MIDEGKTVPMFELSDADGNIVKTKDFKGKKFVVYFYPRDFTPGCTVEADEFSKDYKKFQKLGIDIIGISKDDVESHKKFCKKMSIPYILLADTTTKVSKLFGVWGKIEKSIEEDRHSLFFQIFSKRLYMLSFPKKTKH